MDAGAFEEFFKTVKDSLVSLEMRFSGFETRQGELERRMEQLQLSERPPQNPLMRTEAYGMHSNGGRDSLNVTGTPNNVSDLSSYLERNNIPRASDIFPSRPSYRDEPPERERRRTSLFSFLEDEFNDPQQAGISQECQRSGPDSVRGSPGYGPP
jgi:hypothetical protein